ncbi:MAG: ABC transporter permease subunit, partial [Rhodobacteraceae bacterium]|nr:ABC transporter permease subunit [Paracoccaceae bacterium]
ALAIGLCLIVERALGRAGLFLLRRGRRGLQVGGAGRLATSAAATLTALAVLALVSLAIWSVGWRWTFPALLPESWSLHQWRGTVGWHRALANTLLIGLATTLLSLTLAILWLEAEDRGHFTRARWAEALIYLPLLIPQVAFLYGLNVSLLRAGFMPGLGSVIWAHSLFTFPYVMIALSDPWRALDPRLACSAAALGASPNRVLRTIKLPCLLAPLLTAAAIGFAVSVAQYVPTLFIGAGRIPTLTTEAVALSSGADRRIAGTYGVLQSLLPLLAYGMALALPAGLFRNRLGMSGGAR